MSQYNVTGETIDGKRFDIGVIAYDERDAAFAAKLRCGRMPGVRILYAKRVGA